MKTRSGFVSNSSSSSFILYGIYNPDKERLARALWEHLGAGKLSGDGIETVDDFVELVEDDMYNLESYDLPFEVLHYDEYYIGRDLCITRETLVSGNYTQAELDELDVLLATISDDMPSVHEGDYYC